MMRSAFRRLQTHWRQIRALHRIVVLATAGLSPALVSTALAETPSPATAPPVTLAAAPQPSDSPRLSGSWKINHDLTDSVMKNENDNGAGGFHGGMGGGHHRSGGTGHGQGGEGGGGSGGWSHGDRSGDHQGGPIGLDAVTLALKDGVVTLSDPSGRTRNFHPDGKPVRDESAPGGPAEITASWDKDGDLVVVTKSDKGPKRTETYIVDHERKHLYVTVEMSGWGSGSRRMTRAYDPDVPSAPAATAPAQDPTVTPAAAPTPPPPGPGGF